MNTHIQRAWTAGTNTLVVTIPKYEKDTQGITEGDHIETTFKLIKKNTRSKKSRKDLIIDKTK